MGQIAIFCALNSYKHISNHVFLITVYMRVDLIFDSSHWEWCYILLCFILARYCAWSLGIKKYMSLLMPIYSAFSCVCFITVRSLKNLIINAQNCAQVFSRRINR